MRTGTVWMIASVCGLVAFGSTLVVRAPRPPAAAIYGNARVRGPSLIPDDIETLEQEVRNTGSILAQYDLARRYTWAGRIADATRTWRDLAASADSVMRNDPEPPGSTCFALAEARRSLGQGDNGREDYQRAITIFLCRLQQRGPSPRLYYWLGLCSHRLDNDSDMGQYFGSAEELIPRGSGDMGDLYLLAAMRAMRGEVGEAIAPLEQMVRRDFQDREILEKAEEFERLRGEPRFIALLSKIPPAPPPDSPAPSGAPEPPAGGPTDPR